VLTSGGLIASSRGDCFCLQRHFQTGNNSAPELPSATSYPLQLHSCLLLVPNSRSFLFFYASLATRLTSGGVLNELRHCDATQEKSYRSHCITAITQNFETIFLVTISDNAIVALSNTSIPCPRLSQWSSLAGLGPRANNRARASFWGRLARPRPGWRMPRPIVV
jgi:hypothetical protein